MKQNYVRLCSTFQVNEWHCSCIFCTVRFVTQIVMLTINCNENVLKQRHCTLLDPTAYLWREVSVSLSLHLHHLKLTWVLCYSDCKSHLNKIWYFKYKNDLIHFSNLKAVWSLSSFIYLLFIIYCFSTNRQDTKFQKQ